ncbi:MAG: aminoglycoside phosphotransferase [Pseudonocardiales bacterium]|nr:aminoglycoside phosphotransferase [Pseudonocardiales bacterium]
MSHTAHIEGLPLATTTLEMEQVVRVALRDPGATLRSAHGSPVSHRISAPTTRSITRVRATVQDERGEATVSCIAKELQSARHGLPPHIPADARAQLDRVIPWRLEAQIYASDVAAVMPEGLRMPRCLGLFERPDDRALLWLEDVATQPRAWTPEQTADAARQLGALAARRSSLPALELPGGPFLEVYIANQLRSWALPALADDATWGHPSFAAPELQALRPRIDALAAGLDELVGRVRSVPVLMAHGDPTPMNLLSDGDGLVLIDWGTSTPAPVGFDLLPLVFGRAEAGAAPAQELAGVLAVALPAYRAGLASEGFPVEHEALAAAVVAMAQVRYAFTGLPVMQLDEPVDSAEATRSAGVRRAAFVAAVLDLHV